MSFPGASIAVPAREAGKMIAEEKREAKRLHAQSRGARECGDGKRFLMMKEAKTEAARKINIVLN